VGERLLGRALPPGAWRATFLVRLVATTITFVLVCVAWVFFRATSFAQAFAIVEGLLGFAHHARVISIVDYRVIPCVIAGLLGIHWWMRERPIEDLVERTPWLVRSIVLGTMIFAIVVMQGEDRAFIYFQF
jgi:hypothetical protein